MRVYVCVKSLSRLREEKRREREEDEEEEESDVVVTLWQHDDSFVFV